MRQGAVCTTLVELLQSGRKGRQGFCLPSIAASPLTRKATQQTAQARPPTDRRASCRAFRGLVNSIMRWLGAALLCSISLGVHANGNNCLFQSRGLFMSFGTLDPSSGRDVLVAVSGANTAGDCAPGQTMTISGDNGLNFNGSRNMRNTTGDLIAYSLRGVPQSRPGPGNGRYVVFTFDGAVAWSAYANAPSGTYTDTVIISVSP